MLRLLFCPAVLTFLIGTLAAPVGAQSAGPWQVQHSGTDAALRGVHAVGGGVAWASGTSGTILRTEDSGFVWQTCAVPTGAEKLDFRAIWAWDAQTAVAMSSGPGKQSRLYKTTDGCASWKLLFTNPDEDGFWDALQFWDRDHGVILGDPVAGRFTPFEVHGGSVMASQGIPAIPATTGEGAFAASNASLAMRGRGRERRMWFGTGGTRGAHVYRLGGDSPANWTKVAVPLRGGRDSTGVFAVCFRDARHGLAVGGDYQKPGEPAGTAAWTADGGHTWTAATKPPHGYRSTVAWDAHAKAWIAAGTNGSDISYDDGVSWERLDDGEWNALSLPWIVGPKGRIAKLGTLPGRAGSGKH